MVCHTTGEFINECETPQIIEVNLNMKNKNVIVKLNINIEEEEDNEEYVRLEREFEKLINN